MEIKKKIGIIGIGNCGSQVAYLAQKRYPTLVDSVYINTSESDLSMVDDGLKIKIGNNDYVEGSGKNRSKMKEYLQANINKIVNDSKFEEKVIIDKQYVFIVVSTAGGTGSGAGPVFLEIMKSVFVDPHYILIGVLPNSHASLMELGNTLEFLNELYTTLGDGVTYMIYDNESASHKSPTESLEIVNDAIVEDIIVTSGVYCYPTPYDSIDQADLESIITTPGRLLIARIKSGLTQKIFEDVSVDDLIIKGIKQSCHAETDRNKKAVRWGIITYLSKEVNKLYNSSFNKLMEFIGTPVERFNHHVINEKGDSLNFIHIILSGLSPINDKVKKIKQRIEELQTALAGDEASKYIDENVSYDVMELRKKEEKQKQMQTGVDATSIFNRFKK
jgi:cell division GTPase FtsZ